MSPRSSKGPDETAAVDIPEASGSNLSAAWTCAMVRIIIKGGVWKNTEDEVLKAAIAKYGKNQWARISSLLVRKTPKQCKARWYEWLDPSIKKTEWSKAEDEKLLHLAKLMPTQWRTIAPIVGRTATQCLERYQKLLDEAEARENEELGLAGPGGEAGPSADDIRRLRPGEVDPDPETKPAKPDPIDMDEDEKEMLSEARARLANTQGKKAKRKARERQLEEARRLAVLQKKRELKAAGIISRFKVKKKGMDYNADIPFEHKPALGFYDTSEEQAKATSAPVGQTLRRLENKRKPEEEEAERKKRQRKNEKPEANQTKFLPAREAQIQKLKEAEQISKRRPLSLPQAQVGEAELEEIVKIGQSGQSARSLVADGNDATSGLLGEYEGYNQAKMARTPRTAPQQDMVMAEARNLRNMIQAQTPLLGEENTPLHVPEGTGFQGVTPRHQVAFTPNPLATPRTTNGDNHGFELGGGVTPLRTPARDALGINSSDGAGSFALRDIRSRINSEKRALSSALSSLPEPVNDFSIVIPEDEEESTSTTFIEEDAAERDARLKRDAEERLRRELARRSLAIQKSLPRPVNVNVLTLRNRLENLVLNDEEDPLAEAQRAINDELVRLAEHDSIMFPLPGTSKPGGTASSYFPPDDDSVKAAKQLIALELSESLGATDTSEGVIRESLAALINEQGEDGEESWADLRETLSFDPTKKAWAEATEVDPESIIAGLTIQLNSARDKMAREAARAAKVERKLGMVLGGYQARAEVLSKKLVEGFVTLATLESDLVGFQNLAAIEGASGPSRVEKLQTEVRVLEVREQGQQDRYKTLLEERNRLLASIADLEDRQMELAEEMNVDD